jgi:hypothetical protein
MSPARQEILFNTVKRSYDLTVPEIVKLQNRCREEIINKYTNNNRDYRIRCLHAGFQDNKVQNSFS